MKKRVAAAALSIVMLLGMLPAQAFAVSDPSEQSEPDYNVGSTITDGENQYKVKEYITGERPLVLNYQVKNNTKVIMDVDVSNAKPGFLIGSGKGTGWNQSSSRFGLFVRSNPKSSSQRRVEYFVGTSNALPIADYGNEVYTSQPIQVSLSTTEAKIVGAGENTVTVPISGQTIAEGNTTNLALFAINYSGGIYAKEQSTGVNLYGMQIWEGEELKMNLLPVETTPVVQLGEVTFELPTTEGLYDTVTQSFYTSSAVESGNCKLQIEEDTPYEDNDGETYNRIASIDPNGADYIDTTYLPNADTEITAVYDPAGMSKGWLFHSDYTWGDSGLGYMASASVDNAGAYTFGKVAVTSSNNKSDSIARVTLNADKIEVESVTGTIISTDLDTEQPTAFTTSAPLRLFALNRTSDLSLLETLNGGKLFYLEIKENGEYVHKMYPVERASDSFPGLFDTVTKEFYPFDTPTDIQITSLPTKRFYTTGESFNATGMIVSLLWNSGETTVIPTNAVVISTEDMNTTGTKTVTVSYVRGSETYQATFTIEVVDSVSDLVIYAVAQSGGNQFEVKNDSGRLFLPAGLTFSGTWEGGGTVTYDGQKYASGKLPLVPGGKYSVDGAPINLNIYSSGSSQDNTAISTIFITDVDLTTVHAAKGNESGGNLIKVSADGSQIIVPEDEAESSAGNLDSIKGRGNTSFTDSGNKKPYSVKLDKKAELIAGNKSKKWNLITIYAAHGASVENAMQIFDLTRALRENGMDSPIDFEPVNLYINGEYRGVYMLTEKVEISGNVIAIPDLEDYDVTTDENAVARTTGTLDVQGSQVTYAYRTNAAYEESLTDTTGGYLLEVDDLSRINADAACYIKTAKGISIAIKSPENATEEMVKYIATYVQEFENALMSPSGYNAAGKHYSEYIDMQSMVANYLVEAFAQDVDYGFSSWYFYKDTDSNEGKLNGGIIWDMDGTGRLQGNDPSVLLPARVENNGNPGSVWIKQLLTKGDFMSLLYETNKTVFKSAVADIVNDTAGLRTRTLASATLDRMKWGDRLYGSVSLSAGRSAWEDWLVIRNSYWFGTFFNENSRLLGAAISQDGNTLSADIDGVATSYQWYTVNPETHELTAIDGATGTSYTLSAAGRYVLAATGTTPHGANETMYSVAIDAKLIESTPNATFTATGPDTGTLSNVDAGMQYKVGDGQWVDIESNTDITLTGLAACTISVVKKGDGSSTTDSAAQTIEVTKAETPNLTPEQPDTIDGKGSIPTTTDHEYSTDGSSYNACTGELNDLDAGTYYVRVKASGTVLASEPQTITITAYTPGQESTPNATFTATGPDTGKLSGVENGMQYKVGDGQWVDIESNTDITLTGLTACTISVVRKGNDSTTTDSAAQTITVTKAATPSLTATQPGAIDGKGSIPTDTTHEYSTDGTSYSDCGGALNDLEPDTYYVRVKATGTVLASDPQTITITAYTPGQESTPNATFTATGPDTGTLSNVTAGMQYKVGDGQWVDIESSDNIDLTGLAACTISVVKKGNDSTATDSAAQTIEVTKAATPSLTATQPSTVGGKGSIPTDATHEYKKEEDSSYTACEGALNDLEPGTYYVRVKATGTVLASDPQTITITAYTPGQESTPNATFTATGPDTGKLSGVENGMQYKVGDGQWVDIESNTDITLTGLSACTISVVKKGNGSTTADSVAQAITVTKAETPNLTATQPGTVGGKGSIPTTEAHEYSTDGSSYNACGGALNDLDAGTYYVRVKATGTVLASAPQEITINAAPVVYTIRFDPNGGSVDPTSGITDTNGKLSELPTPTRSGSYSFNGWYTAASGGTQVTAEYVFTADGTIYAQWTYTGGGSSSGSSSSGSNVSGSGSSVSVSVSGGSVSTSQMESAVKKADEGSAITIKATASSAVSLPVGGMADAVDNSNDVLVDLRNGEITLSAQAIAGLTDGLASSGKIKVSITSQTSSKDEAISDLLDKGAEVFDVSVEVNGKGLHSFEGDLTITFTVSNLSRISDPHVLHILADGTREYYAPDSVSGDNITVKGIRNLSTFAVIPGSEVPEEQTNPFSDVTTSDYYYDAVLWAVEKGITNGTNAAGTTFSPDVEVSRAQMVTFLWRAHGAPKADGANPFTDVSESDYYYDAVLWAVANGVTKGTSATTFSPDMDVTRAQAVTFQWRAAGDSEASGSSFDDVAADAWYTDAVTWAVANEITNGTGGNHFSPDVVVSRAQAVTFLYRELA